MKKVVIILTQAIENNTSSMIRCKSIISELPQLGYKVCCFCPYPSSSSEYAQVGVEIKDIVIKRFGSKMPIDFSKKDKSSSKSIKSKVISIIHKIFKKVDVFGASLQYLKYRPQLFKEIQKEQPQVLLTFSDPMTAHMIGKYIRQRINLKYIQQWGDPLTTDIISKTALPKWVRYLIEKNLIKYADKICYVSPITCVEQQNLFKKYASRMIFIPTPYIEYSYQAKEKKLKDQQKISFGYFGSYNSIARNLQPFYEAACRAKECKFDIIGNSDIVLQSTENVTIKGRVSQNELESFVYSTDVIVCLMNSKGNQIPGKLYHDAGTDKEILVIKDGEYGNQIEEFFSPFDRYTFVENEEDKIYQVLMNYMKNGVPKRKSLEEFNSKVVTNKLISL